MVYNDTFMNNVTNVVQLVDGLQSATGYEYLFGILILVSVFLIYLAFASTRFDWMESVVTGSFISIIVAVLLYGIGWLPIVYVSFPLVLLSISLVWSFLSNA